MLDIAVPSGALPAINEMLEIEWDGPWRLTVEVQSHLDPESGRAVALQSSTGRPRGTAVVPSAGRSASRSGRPCSAGS